MLFEVLTKAVTQPTFSKLILTESIDMTGHCDAERVKSTTADRNYFLWIFGVLLHLGGCRDAFYFHSVGADTQPPMSVVSPCIEHPYACYTCWVRLATGNHINFFCTQFRDNSRYEHVFCITESQLALLPSTPTEDSTISCHTHAMELSTCYSNYLFCPWGNFNLQFFRHFLVSFISETQGTVRTNTPRIHRIRLC